MIPAPVHAPQHDAIGNGLPEVILGRIHGNVAIRHEILILAQAVVDVLGESYLQTQGNVCGQCRSA